MALVTSEPAYSGNRPINASESVYNYVQVRPHNHFNRESLHTFWMRWSPSWQSQENTGDGPSRQAFAPP
eukprot:scaffold37347_cov38-Prasinocladus_malaysianus.AAC.2